MSKELAWSYSRLNNYETCAKKYWHTSVIKNIREGESEAMRYGKDVHKSLELRVRDGTDLPLHLMYLEPIAAKFAGLKGDKLTEQQLAINRKFEPTGWYDKDVWCRAILDLAVVNGERALLVDWKTGRLSSDFTQMRLAGAMYLLHVKKVKKLRLMYYWIKEKKPTVETLTRDSMKKVWIDLLPRVNRYNAAHKTTEFPARPGFLCKNYCPVKSCPHNGV